MKNFSTNILIAAGLLCHLEWATAGQDGGFRISGYLGTGEQADTVVLEGGVYEGIKAGDTFRVVRPAASRQGTSRLPIETGTAKVIAVYEHQAMAQIIEQSTEMSRRVLGSFPEVMAGDVAFAKRLDIHPVAALLPEVELRYSRLFEDDKSNPTSFELTPAGRDLIASETIRHSDFKGKTLMVIGHTDARGAKDTNQIESFQRALVVRQYLIDQLGFDGERVVALGKGEDDLPEGDLTPNFADQARRIVIKVVSAE